MFRHLILLRSLELLLDAGLVYGAFLLAYFLRVGWIFSTDFPFPLYAQLSLLATFLWIGFLVFAKYYRIPPRSGKTFYFDILLAILGGLIALGFLVVTYFFPRSIVFSRLIPLYTFLLGVGSLLFTQYLFRWLLRKAKSKKIGVYRTLIIGNNRIAEKLIQSIQKDPYTLYEVIGVIDPYGISKTIAHSQILGKLDQLESITEKEGITSIIQCDAFEHTLNLISFAEEKNIKFEFHLSLRGIYEDNLPIRIIAGKSVISFVQRDFENKGKRGLYRIVDILLRQVFDVD